MRVVRVTFDGTPQKAILYTWENMCFSYFREICNYWLQHLQGPGGSKYLIFYSYTRCALRVLCGNKRIVYVNISTMSGHTWALRICVIAVYMKKMIQNVYYKHYYKIESHIYAVIHFFINAEHTFIILTFHMYHVCYTMYQIMINTVFW